METLAKALRIASQPLRQFAFAPTGQPRYDTPAEMQEASRNMQQFRRSGQRDDRRRRVLNESLLAPAEEAAPTRRRRRSARDAARRHKSLHYGDAAFLDEQPHLTDLVPVSPVAYGVLLILGIAIIAGLEFLYSSMPGWAATATDGRIAAFDLDGEGSLAVWFSSLTLLLTAAASLVVLYVRQYRTDDYQGRYRIWLWAALCWLMMSIDETASLHEGFKELMARVSGTRITGDGSLWWVIPYFFALAAIGMRLLVDIRACRLSAGAMLSAAGCYGLAVLAQLGWVFPESGARGVMLEEGAEMAGNWLLLLAVLLYARHVILDAHGCLPVQNEPRGDTEQADSEKPALAEDEQEPETAPHATRAIKVHPPHGVPRPLRTEPAASAPGERPAAAESRPAPAVKSAPVSVTKPASPSLRDAVRPIEAEDEEDQEEEGSEGDGPDDDGIDPKLSRSEKRALRKRLKRQQRQQQKRLAG